MVCVDLLIDDPSLAEDVRAAVAASGATVSDIEGESAAFTGAEIEHIIQVVAQGLASAAIKDLTLGLKTVLTKYWRQRETGFSVVVDGIRYRVTKESDIDSVLDAIAEASDRARLPK